MIIARKLITLSALSLLLAQTSLAQDVYATQRAGWLKKAAESKPALVESVRLPVSLVTLVKDAGSFQGWKAVKSNPVDSLYQSSFKKQSGVVVDFGEHMTGHFSFTIKARRGTPDAPTRLKFTFGEVPSELATPFDPYPGTLSRAWLQDEIVTVMDMPATVTISRRLAFRYVAIELLGTSQYFDFGISALECKATTSAGTVPAGIATTADSMVKRIDAVGIATLAECMQTVYEDGPKRDRRLWIGDLYLEALANSYSFKNHGLTRRCLYLLAGLSHENGAMSSNVFETPEPHAQVGAPFLFDYSLLYNVAVKDYLTATNDRTTALDLWPLVRRQLDNPGKYLRADGMFDYAAATKAGWWLFVDWNNALDREASLQGIIIYAMKQTYELAKMLGKEKELSELPALIEKLTRAAREHLYNKGSGLFTSGPQKQISYASQAWMVISGVATKAEGQRALKAVASLPDAVRPGAPYLYHYYVEALLTSGLQAEAKKALTDYWGGMIKKGADTFWEVYDPANELLSPYNFYPVNSYCHAWSCTPVYFIRKYPEVFQR